MSETAKEREQRWLRERADAEDKCESVAVGGGMSEQPTPPPWERTTRDPRTDLDTCVMCASNYGYEEVAKRAWSELCDLRTRLAALERVAKAAGELEIHDYRGYDELLAAIVAAKETTCESL